MMIKAQQERRRQLLAERSKQNYQKHYNICSDVLGQIIDVVTKIGHYRELTQGYGTGSMDSIGTMDVQGQWLVQGQWMV